MSTSTTKTSLLCTMVGYDEHSPGYLLFRSRRKPNSTVANNVIVRRDVVFDEAFKSSCICTHPRGEKTDKRC